MIDLCGIQLRHPVLNGSGTFDAIAARHCFAEDLFSPDRFPFAAFVSKTITPEPRAGNPPPRLWEMPGGLVNSIGLPNKGLDGFLAEDLPKLSELPVPLIVSVMATSIAEFARLVEGVGPRNEVTGLELNISCPNVKSGLIVGESPQETGALLTTLRPLTDKPLIVKLTPNVPDPAEIALAAEDAGADAVSMINTIRSVPVDPASGDPWLGGTGGGLSGPTVKKLALEHVGRVATEVRIPVVGMGGISSGRDALDFLESGATAVAVGTESFRNPMAGQKIASEICSQSA